MADVEAAKKGLGMLEGFVRGGQTVVTLMDGAKKIANESPEVKAMFIEKQLNDGKKLGVEFERDGTVVVGRMNGTQANNLINAYSQLSEAEREKLFGGKLNLELDLQRDRTKPDGPVTGATFKIDAKKIDDWTRFSQALDYFKGKDGSAPAIKAAVETGDVTKVRTALGTKAPEGASQGQAPAASNPQLPLFLRKRKAFLIDSKIRFLILLRIKFLPVPPAALLLPQVAKAVRSPKWNSLSMWLRSLHSLA